MSKYLIDTNIIIDLLHRKASIDPKFLTSGASISVITLAELYYGAEKSVDPQKSFNLVRDLIIDLDIEITHCTSGMAKIFGGIKAKLEKEGRRLEDFDLLIAATAMSEDKVLITNNKKHFNRIEGLTIAD